MELTEIIRRRRMVHTFEQRPVDRALLETLLESARHAPSGGHSQGFTMVAITEPDRVRRFWEVMAGPAGPAEVEAMAAAGPPVLVLTLVSKRAYLDRYSLPDKEPAGMQAEESWPVPYWYVDGGCAVMLLLLRAVDLGVDGWYFGGTHEQVERICAEFGVPAEQQLIGILGLGYRAPDDVKLGSSVTIPRRAVADVLHWERW